MDELASQLGISKKTIYHYYEDKNSIVHDVMTGIIAKSQNTCMFSSVQAENAVHEIFITMDQIKNDFQNLNPIIIHDLEKYFPETFEMFKVHKSQFIYKLIYDNLVKGKLQGLYRTELNEDIMTKFRIESILLGFNQNIFPAEKYKLTDVTFAILEHFIYGIATPEGHKLIEKYKNQQ